jgi:hypothetical protein
MRTTAFVLFTLCVIACAAPQATPQSEPIANATPPIVEVRIDLDKKTSERLALGLPVHVALRTASADVGACTLSFDLWEEHYRVAFSKTDVLHAPDVTAALRMCVDMDRVRHASRGKRIATVSVHEVLPPKPLYERRPYPEF